MPPRTAALLFRGPARFPQSRLLARPYSQSAEPLIHVTNLPAPNTGHIRILELNRASARNAISRSLLASLRAEVDAVSSQYGDGGEELPVRKLFGGAAGVDQKGPTRALVLASAVDNCFCAGADLKERKGFTKEEYAFSPPPVSSPVFTCTPFSLSPLLTNAGRTDEFLSNLRDTLTSLETLPIPTISAISSVALGGGLELALATHFRVLTSNAVVGLPETRLGIIPGAGGTYRLPALIGLARARDLIITGRRVSAPEAYFLGVADRLVEVKEEEGEKKEAMLERARRGALSEAVRLATEICEGGPVAVRSALKAVAFARPEMENKMYERIVQTEDRDEALKAFQEKRKPVFKGR